MTIELLGVLTHAGKQMACAFRNFGRVEGDANCAESMLREHLSKQFVRILGDREHRRAFCER